MKILVIRFAAIGDCVMAAWPVTALRETFPNAQITWAVQQTPVPVIDTYSLVNELAVFPREEWKKARWSPNTWREQLSAYTRLRKHKFDIGIDFQGHSKTAILLKLSGAKTRIASSATDALARKLNPQLHIQPRSTHAVDAFYAALEQLRISHRAVKPIMPDVSTLIQELQTRVGHHKPVVTIQTGASRAERIYPIEHWVRVAGMLQTEGFSVIGIGGPKDPHLPEEVATDWVGKLSLRECMAAVAFSKVHIAGDTGTGHMAAALGVPVVSIFGMDAPRMEKYRPWTELRAGLREGNSPALVSPDSVVRAALELQARHEHALSH